MPAVDGDAVVYLVVAVDDGEMTAAVVVVKPVLAPVEVPAPDTKNYLFRSVAEA